MDGNSQHINDVNMVKFSEQDPFIELSIEEKKELLEIMRQRKIDKQRTPLQNIQIRPQAPITRASLPKWNGKAEEFSFYMRRLMARIEREWEPYVDQGSICLDMIDSLPDHKRPRIAAWLEDNVENYCWRNLAEHFREQFEDKEERQAASKYVSRMEQSHNQLFLDFLKDSEYRMAPCREAFTPLAKSMQFKASLNSRLRRALVGLDLPPLENNSEWVKKVTKVAIELEGLKDYRPVYSEFTTTNLGVSKGGVNVPVEKQSRLDADGDVIMGESNALLSAIKSLVLNRENGVVGSKGKTKGGSVREKAVVEKPRAPVLIKS
ncbi:hypothetical protein EV44_g3125 [Erysiphe necator]|uniref:Uncharacterized protein n=1 Tax=Uncinula necator TaxID=52586 RepID=A0A0B1P9G5_UNCNE|nr:hypothetical protein EV44_g3125 [Erysiphe necator]